MHFIKLIFIFFLLFFAGLFANQKLLDAAVRAVNKGEFSKAEFLLKQAGIQGANKAIVDYNLAYVYFRKKDISGALSSYENVIRLAPLFKNSYHNMARIYYQFETYDFAVNILKKYLLLNELDGETHLLIGDIYKTMDAQDLSDYHYQRGIDLDSSNTEPILAMADLYIELKDFEKALSIIQDGFIDASDPIELMKKESDIYFLMDKFIESASLLDIIIKSLSNRTNSEYYNINYQLANIYIDGNYYFLAENTLLPLLDSFPKKNDTVSLLKYIYQVKNDMDKSFVMFKKIFLSNKSKGYLGIKEILKVAYNRENKDLMEQILEFYDREGIRDEIYNLSKSIIANL